MNIKETLNDLASKQILILDGAMGTMIQRYGLKEEDFRGNTYTNHPSDLKGNNDLLSITRPDIIHAIHTEYLEAGADIIETNTFSGTWIAQADYHLEKEVYRINYEGAKVAKQACLDFMQKHPERKCFVAGAFGPTNRTASLSPDVNNPGYRAITFDQLVDAYSEQATALIDGGADRLLIKTVFDTLNCKAALFAVEKIQREKGTALPVMVSGTITDASGRTLSGQTLEAFYFSIEHANPISVGFNCALGATQMRPHIEELSELASCYVSAYPNAGLPNAFGEYDEQAHETGHIIEEWAKEGLVNIVGGCCGTTPDHIKCIADAVRNLSPRKLPILA